VSSHWWGSPPVGFATGSDRRHFYFRSRFLSLKVLTVRNLNEPNSALSIMICWILRKEILSDDVEFVVPVHLTMSHAKDVKG